MAESTTNKEQYGEINNMLAQLAHKGNGKALEQLWELNRPVLRKMFWRWYSQNKGIADAAGLTIEDFEQESYFAVQKAAASHDPEKGSFLTMLQFAVKTQIHKATCGAHGRVLESEDGRQVRVAADPLNEAASLEEPIGGEENDFTRADTIADPEAAGELQAVEESLYIQELRAALEEALAALPARQREIIIQLFYERLTLQQAGQIHGVTRERVRQIALNGLRQMQRNTELRRFYGEDLLARAYRGTGFGAWKNSGSVEERLVENREQEQRRLEASSTRHLAELLGMDIGTLAGMIAD